MPVPVPLASTHLAPFGVESGARGMLPPHDLSPCPSGLPQQPEWSFMYVPTERYSISQRSRHGRAADASAATPAEVVLAPISQGSMERPSMNGGCGTPAMCRKVGLTSTLPVT